MALIGKVYCKVDARYSAIEMGDLLTTSPTRGYAMKAADPVRAFGSVLGKALQGLARGKRATTHPGFPSIKCGAAFLADMSREPRARTPR
jgi:hypothetical protein